MKSKATFNGHPIHPILVPFPIAFFTGTFVLDILGFWLSKPGFLQAAGYLEIGGILGGLAAATPGIIDYFYTVPPDSSARQRAAKHGIINVTMVFIFAIAAYLRYYQEVSQWLIIGLEASGMVLLSIAGWMGGTLAYRNQIGVYNRYAHAGNWSEAHLGEQKGRVEVAGSDELKSGQMKLLHINRKRIVLGKADTGYAAFEDRCTHKGGSLAGGALICDTVQCPWHGSQFDVNTGKVKAGPATQAIKPFPFPNPEAKFLSRFESL